MPRVLIVYGTTDGQTEKICYFLAGELMRHGATVEVAKAGIRTPAPVGFDTVVVAASVHAGGYQRSVIRWVRENAGALEVKSGTFISVCLGVLEENPRTRSNLDRILEGFVARGGWRPARVKEVAGALKYTRYGWLKRMAMRYIAGKAGGSTDTSRDHEYTDWEDLRVFADSLMDGWTERVIPSVSEGSRRDPKSPWSSAAHEDLNEIPR
jgi:menaquinone-dependent protoporphyrinogen oxidase